MKKQYDLPDDVKELFEKYVALQELRGKYVKRPCGFRKARECAIQSRLFRVKFWEKVRELYPEFKDKDMVYTLGKIIVKDTP
ncbi:MAG TPA: hypothetical protein VMW95_06695 [Desulfobacterales bacterium]|nr:hypothetical protein [Desulfobacterales bacterium]